jgi:hypothetical protein
MPRKISRRKREQVTGGWIKLLRKQLQRLHCSQNNDQIMWDVMDGTSGIYGGWGGGRDAYTFLVANPKRKRTRGKTRFV